MFLGIPLLTLIVATVIAFVVGGLWYSPLLFQKAWMAGQPHRKREDYKNSVVGMIVQVLHLFVTGFVMSVIVLGLAPALGAVGGAVIGFLMLGLMTGFGMISGGIFMGHSAKFMAINVGQQLLTLAIFAVALVL